MLLWGPFSWGGGLSTLGFRGISLAETLPFTADRRRRVDGGKRLGWCFHSPSSSAVPLLACVEDPRRSLMAPVRAGTMEVKVGSGLVVDVGRS